MAIPSPLFNCQQATLLIERRADETLPSRTRVQLWAHLRLCPQCRRYAFQSTYLNRLAVAAALREESTSTILPAPARQRIQALLNERARGRA